MADARENDHKHGKHGWLQQQAKASNPWNESRRQQCRKSRNKKIGTKTDGRGGGGASKINPPNSHLSNPIHKAATAAQDPQPKKRVRFNLPSDEVGEIEEELKDKTPQHEINKTAVIIGVVGVAALLIIALR